MSSHQHTHPPGRDSASGPHSTGNVPVVEQQESTSASGSPNQNVLSGIYHRNKAFLEGLAFLAGILVFLIAVNEVVDKVIDRKLSDPSILHKIAAESRPMLVFKGNESIVADEGAAQFIKIIEVTRRTALGETNLPSHIHIELTKFFPQPPILTLITPAFCVVTTERGKGLSWEFGLEYSSMVGTADIGNQMLFRFEILP